MNTCRRGVRASIRELLTISPSAVDDSLIGYVTMHPTLVLLGNDRIVMRRDHRDLKGKVKLLSGGGTGHEPSEIGFVGEGMLTAAVLGDVFTTPPSSTILRAIRELGKDHVPGVMLIVKNCTGDRLNFAVAMEKALNEDIKVKILVVGEDVANLESERQNTHRGLAGTVLIHKIAGAMAESGHSLDDILSLCQSITTNNLATIGVTLRSKSASERDINIEHTDSDEELQLGAGIHGEPGLKHLPYKSPVQAVKVMLDLLEVSSLPKNENCDPQIPLVILINNMGASAKLEENLFAFEVLELLQHKGYNVIRTYCGTFFTSLATAGFSITVLRVTSADILEYLDANASAPCWTLNTDRRVLENLGDEFSIRMEARFQEEEQRETQYEIMIDEKSALSVLQVVSFAAKSLIACEKLLNSFDGYGGDRDCGSKLKRGAEATEKAIKSGQLHAQNFFVLLREMSDIANNVMGGMAGALYSIFFEAASKAFHNNEEVNPASEEAWLLALELGTNAVSLYGCVVPGDGTMVDPLAAAATVWRNLIQLNDTEETSKVDWERRLGKVVAAVEQAASNSAAIRKHTGSLIVPDPGAHAVYLWFKAAYQGACLLF